MTKTQYKRWKQVSIGLATHCYPNITVNRRTKLIEEVENCIDLAIQETYENSKVIKEWEDVDGGVDNFLFRYSIERKVRKGIELIRGNFGHMVNICVRAGFDLAVKQSAGVVGFTIGDVFAVFEGKIPKWVTIKYEPNFFIVENKNKEIWL